MKVYIPTDTFFNYSQCKALYEKYKDLIGDIDDFCKILLTTQFFSFFSSSGNFVGCLYFYHSSDGKLMMNGFSNRGMHLENIKAIQLASNWYKTDIYAKTPHKTAVFCLLRAGFKKIDDKLYIKRKGD